MATFDELLKAQAVIANEIARKAALPAEPQGDENGFATIWFSKVYSNGGIKYTYSAVYIPNLGIWYVSGTRSRFATGAKWEHLIEWITDCVKWELWECTAYEYLGSSLDE